jgi:hypothetical protein
MYARFSSECKTKFQKNRSSTPLRSDGWSQTVNPSTCRTLIVPQEGAHSTNSLGVCSPGRSHIPAPTGFIQMYHETAVGDSLWRTV